ncbi:hypothetical protein TFLX_02919 [Thermoflexales bacterium]|nr:hypothetical protein TFLX_02919 [Thermoflexales bacterium]
MNMTVNDLECPNCGASVEFAHGSRARCPFCKSALLLTGDSVQTTGALADLREEPASPTQSATPVRPMFVPARRKGLSGLLKWGCLFAVVSQILFVCVCGVFVALATQVLLQIGGPVEQVTAIVNQEPEVVRALGQPLKLGIPTNSNFQSNKQGASVKFSAPLSGSKGNGRVRVEGRQTSGKWDLDIWVTYADDNVERQVFIQRRAVP